MWKPGGKQSCGRAWLLLLPAPGAPLASTPSKPSTCVPATAAADPGVEWEGSCSETSTASSAAPSTSCREHPSTSRFGTTTCSLMEGVGAFEVTRELLREDVSK
eukprot:CAMPEP_0179857818 /NCGR_PEP_ID=MMETSP0982-20121206/11981_1 /TAXON_ID=483367 /ORGANISM="non described non described, Strain CCMP 2436" /LENGTH=103 /DNA_ID=CAMNT_0021744419 /DNA_START=245 /DNA_END=556 /DNA_ORIENTATION=+